MCCGRGVKAAASKQYVDPAIEAKMTEEQKKKLADKKKLGEKLAAAKPVLQPGAYYGNPIEKKSKKEKAPKPDEEDVNLLSQNEDTESEDIQEEL